MVNCEMDLPETKDLYLNALLSFNPNQQRKPELDDYLTIVAKTGCTLFDWSTIKRYFLYKLETVMKEINEVDPFDETVSVPNTEHCDSKGYIERILNAAESFDGIPFTIQRLAELLTNPRKHYRRADKFFRALEKNVVIVTTVSPDGDRETNRNATPMLMNGKSDDTVMLSGDEANGGGSFVSVDVTMEDGSREPSSTECCDEFNEFGVPTPRPMPSIETLWESAHNAEHRTSPTAGGVPLTLLDDEPTGVVADTSLDSLSPSISQAMAGGADDLLSKETYWSSMGAVTGPTNQLATMTPLQVSQLSSSSSPITETPFLESSFNME